LDEQYFASLRVVATISVMGAGSMASDLLRLKVGRAR
jgi:hypothetical protein